MHSQHMREWAAAGLLAGVLALVGCGSDDDATTSAAATRTPTATATVEAAASFPEEMRGEWKRVMKTKDWALTATRSVRGASRPTGKAE